MTELMLESVFKISGVPTHTFVEPSHSHRLKVALRTPGRGVVIEGPSGIGKSTAVSSSLEELGLADDVLQLSARSPSDMAMIRELTTTTKFGLVVVDDFHRLPADDRNAIANLLKRLADSESADDKLVLIGINQAGAALIDFAPDLVNRIDRIKFESEPDSKIRELIDKGEKALNISLEAVDGVVQGAQGSFYLAQLLCHELCTQQGATESQPEKTVIRTLYSSAKRQVMERQRSRFDATIKSFVRGTRFRTGGRAPYFHILKWLADSPEWTIDLQEEIRRHPNEKVSVKVVVDQNYIGRLCENTDIAAVLYYNFDAKALTVEDPLLMYYLKNLDWSEFVREVGFTNVSPGKPYDVALSFAGEDRPFAEHLLNNLEEFDLAVFYDRSEESRIMANDVAAVLAPVYASDSRFVVVVLGEKYGLKKWTIFESSNFKNRIARNEVIPIHSVDIPPSAFDPLQEKGGRTYDPSGDLAAQAKSCAEAIAKKLVEADEVVESEPTPGF